jgi:hypothetical protein
MNEVTGAITRGGRLIIAIVFLILSFQFDPLLWSISGLGGLPGLGALFGLFLMAVIMVLEVGTAFEIAAL